MELVRPPEFANVPRNSGRGTLLSPRNLDLGTTLHAKKSMYLLCIVVRQN